MKHRTRCFGAAVLAALVLAMLCVPALAAEIAVDYTSEYQFSAADFSDSSELEGVYISAVPPAYQAELCIGSRVLRRGDILPAAALEKLKLRPVCLGEADCELVYCPISAGTLGDAVTVRRGALHGVTINAAPIPDLIPVLSVVASVAEGETRVENAYRLRLKESDRLKSTANLLRALGGQVKEKEDGLVITGVPALHGGAVETQNDHRLAMSAATAACAATGEITVDNDGCVAKSYPRFWEDFSSLKGEGL